MQGMGALFWMPVIIKYGRRPVYLMFTTLYSAYKAWAGGATSYESEITAHIIMGLAAGAIEVMAPLTISDIFFLHKRGTIMVYTPLLYRQAWAVISSFLASSPSPTAGV